MVLYSLRDFIQPVFSHSCVLCKLPVEIPICESVAPNMHRACSRQIIIPEMDALVLQLHEEGIPSKLSGGRSETVPMALTIPKTRNKSTVCHMMPNFTHSLFQYDNP